MDFGNAALLALVVFVGVEFLKKILPTLDARIVITSTLAIGIGAVFLVAETVWAHQQVISGKALDELDVASKFVTGIFLAAGATGIHKVLAAVKNVGENHDGS